jgi:hypothetical protein
MIVFTGCVCVFPSDFFSSRWNKPTSSVNRTSNKQARSSHPADVILLGIMTLLAIAVWVGLDLAVK